MDWTVPFDDGLTARLQACTLCGKRPVGFWGVCGLERVGLAIAYVLCPACHRQGLAGVEALLERRYGGGVDATREAERPDTP